MFLFLVGQTTASWVLRAELRGVLHSVERNLPVDSSGRAPLSVDLPIQSWLMTLIQTGLEGFLDGPKAMEMSEMTKLRPSIYHRHGGHFSTKTFWSRSLDH